MRNISQFLSVLKQRIPFFLDLAIERVFKEDGGVLGFLKLTINQCKVFKNENVKSFDLLCKIIELHPEKVAQYATNTIIVSIFYFNRIYCFIFFLPKTAVYV